MHQSDRPARRSAPHGPKRRGDATRLASIDPGARRGAERRPYPTASTTTRVSPAKPGSPRARSRSRGQATTPTPATVWTAGPAPIDLEARWPVPIVEKIVDAFSKPGERVALLPWPTVPPAPSQRPRLAPVFSDGVPTHVAAAEPDSQVAAARAAVEGLQRSARVVCVPVDQTAAGPGSRPFWADLVQGPDGSAVTGSVPARSDVDGGVLDGAEAASADTDLIVTSLRPQDGGDHTSDLVALVAARLLRVGGILVVITHCDWSAGELSDPTGAVVAAAQNADLLYLQHIVALHSPVREGRFAVASDTEPGGASADDEARTAHRAQVRGLPTPHQRIHSDVLVFAQPHDHKPPRLDPAVRASETGVIR
ncbi:hypothetical protein [Amycolatopsis sp. NPDC059657]|uniref:hypothetical protein n=1 Tax=Amycolatopsis sp. NPDC059657 TaxID=3346899 RepID=UPI00366F51BB